jgi:hypothetical protein
MGTKKAWKSIQQIRYIRIGSNFLIKSKFKRIWFFPDYTWEQ